MNRRSGFRTGAVGQSSAAPLGLYNPLGLETFWTACENRNTSPVKILCVGDSWIAGTFANGFLWTQTWTGVMRDTLLSLLPVTGSPACGFYYPVWNTSGASGPGPNWSVTGGTQQSQFGPGAANIFANSAMTATLTVAGTSADLWFVLPAGVTTGTASWQVDSGPVTNVTITGTGLAHGQDGHLVNISLGGATTHKITVKWVSGNVTFDGAYVYDGDESKGFNVYQSGHSGWATTNWISDETVGFFGQNRLAGVIKPHLIVYMLGRNDYNLVAISAATYKTNLNTLITNATGQAGNSPSVLIVSQAACTVTGAPTDTWQDFLVAMMSFAESSATNAATATFFDLSPYFPAEDSPLASTATFYTSNHPTVAVGHKLIGTDVADAITSGEGTSPGAVSPSYLSAAIGAVTVTTGTTTIATTASLTVGVWRFTCCLTIEPVTTNAISFDFEVVVGSATATFSGKQSGAAGMDNQASLVRDVTEVFLDCIVTVTVAGTLVVQGITTGGNVNVLASTPTATYPSASGYVAQLVGPALA